MTMGTSTITGTTITTIRITDIARFTTLPI
jgi:hypothetical protein